MVDLHWQNLRVSIHIQGNVIEKELTNAHSTPQGRKQNQASTLTKMCQDLSNCDQR